MDGVKIQTTQNVEINYEIASVGDRILAVLLDMVIIMFYVIGMLFVTGFISAMGLGTTGVVIMLIFYLPVIFYHLLFEIFMDGQTPGKKKMKIKVIKLNGGQPTVGNYLIRWILRIVDEGIFTGVVAIITILINGKGQRLGDIAAGTTVIKLKPRTRLEDTVYQFVEEDYTPVFPQVNLLDNQTISIVKEVLNVQIEDSRMVRQRSLARKTKAALEKKMGIQSDMTPEIFLETVIKDYNYIKSME